MRMNLRYAVKNGQWHCWNANRNDLEFYVGSFKHVPKNPDGVGDTYEAALGAAVDALFTEGADCGGVVTILNITRCGQAANADEGGFAVPTPKAIKPVIDTFIPEGYEFVRVGRPKNGEHYLKTDKLVVKCGPVTNGSNLVIVRPADTKAFTVKWIAAIEIDAHSAVDAARKVKKAANATTDVFEVYEHGKHMVRVNLTDGLGLTEGE